MVERVCDFDYGSPCGLLDKASVDAVPLRSFTFVLSITLEQFLVNQVKP